MAPLNTSNPHRMIKRETCDMSIVASSTLTSSTLATLVPSRKKFAICPLGRKLRVYARLPPNNGYVGTFHYAPSAGNSAFIFFEKSIIREEEIERLHRIKVHPFTGCFHSKPGHYSKLHGLQNYQRESNDDDDEMMSQAAGRLVMLDHIRSSLVETRFDHPSSVRMSRVISTSSIADYEESLNEVESHQNQNLAMNRLVREMHTQCLKWGQLQVRKSIINKQNKNNRFLGAIDVRRGRFGECSVDDAAAYERSQSWGKDHIHWGGNFLIENGVPYGRKIQRICPMSADLEALESKFQKQRQRSGFAMLGWESHTVKAHEKTAAYLHGLGCLAPKMNPNNLLLEEITKMYDVQLGLDCECLGEGASSIVRSGVHRETGHPVAIKIIQKRYLLTKAEKASVEREMENQRRLVHRHVIRLYETYDTTDALYLVLERALCGSLEDFLFVRRFVTELEAKIVLKQILDAIQNCHSQGIVHCDIKPANILLSEVESQYESSKFKILSPSQHSTLLPPSSITGLIAKLCDFGHSRKVPDVKYYKYTGDIHRIPHHLFEYTGTEGYIAPEVLAQEAYGKGADMWSFGVLMYKMLSGVVPWRPSINCLKEPLRYQGRMWSNISQQAKDLLKALLEIDQDMRLSAAEALNNEWFSGIDHCAGMSTVAPRVATAVNKEF